MKSLRNYLYAAVLALSLAASPSLLSAQDAIGKFTLTHQVHWQNAQIPAGEYRFSLESRGPSDMLFLQKLSGAGAGFMIMSSEIDAASTAKQGSIFLVGRSGEIYVSSMELPSLGRTLHFALPNSSEQKQVASTPPVPVTSPAR